MNVAIVGCGLIGKKRARTLQSFHEDQITLVCDKNRSRAKNLARELNCENVTDWQEIVRRADIQVVINSSINAVLEPITCEMLRSKKHVLCEKPLGRNATEAMNMVQAAEEHGVLLKTGFNHRFHPAIWKAKQCANEGLIGRILTIRARYGHGGRSGMEREWRASRELCGGGELLDQGVHIIDLIRWFGGEVVAVFGKTETKFWDLEVEDNAFAVLRTDQKVTASFHVSWTNWKNIFSLEIFGDKGFLHAEGLGGSYGPETLEFGERRKEGGRPEITVFRFPEEDVSWEKEWLEFRSAINENRQPIANGLDGLQANRVIEALYESSKSKKEIQLF